MTYLEQAQQLFRKAYFDHNWMDEVAFKSFYEASVAVNNGEGYDALAYHLEQHINEGGTYESFEKLYLDLINSHRRASK